MSTLSLKETHDLLEILDSENPVEGLREFIVLYGFDESRSEK